MIDRNVQFPNRFQLTKVEGTDDIYDLTPAPGTVEEEGDLINKATLLKDSTAGMYGLDNTAVPDDVLAKIAPTFTSINAVGTIRQSVRTDLGEDWLLCNGEEISRNDYPDLSNIIPAYPNQSMLGGLGQTFGTLKIIKKLKYLNGLYIACGSVYTNSNFQGAIAYATSLSGPWTTVAISDFGTSSTVSVVNDIIYGDGYYVAVGGYITSSGYTQTVISATTNLDTGWFASTTSYSSSNSYYGHMWMSAIYVNGYYIVAGARLYSSNTVVLIAYTQDPSSNTSWTAKEVYSSPGGDGISIRYTTCTVYNIDYINGQYVVCGYADKVSGNSFQGSEGLIYYTADFTGTWTKKVIASTSAGNMTASIVKLIYENGQYVAVGKNSGITALWVSSTINGVYAQKTIFNDNQSSLNASMPMDLVYESGLYMVVGSVYDSNLSSGNNTTLGYIAYSSNGVDWTVDKMTATVGVGVFLMAGLLNIFSQEKELYFVGNKYYSGSYYPIKYYVDDTKMLLPQIAMSNAYTYIKALEG